MSTRLRLLALGGVIGPLTFIGCWAIAGAVTDGYSPIDDAISDLAAVDASTRVAMTVGFVVFGLGLIAFGFALRASLTGGAWLAAIATGCVHDRGRRDAARRMVGRRRARGSSRGWGTRRSSCSPRSPRLRSRHAAGPVGHAPPGSRRSPPPVPRREHASDTAHGAWQRLGLSIGDVWIATTAVALATMSGPFATHGSESAR